MTSMGKIANRGKLGSHSTMPNAFSLVEVVLSLGVVSFALISLLGMLPLGVSTFRNAISTTRESQIAQTLASEIQLSDYSSLKATNYYYDMEGSPVSQSSPNLIYTAAVTPTNFTSASSPVTFVGNSATNVVMIITSHSAPPLTNSVVVFNNNQ